MRPVIGIIPVCDGSIYQINKAYCLAVDKSGGIPVICSYQTGDTVTELFSFLDGLLLTGGGDIDPVFFHQEPVNGLGQVDTKRDSFELQLCRMALKEELPVLGICRGMQILAVADGGSVLQNIDTDRPDSVLHMQNAPKSACSHTIYLKENCCLASLWKKTSLRVNSFHHQAVQDPGAHFEIIAYAADTVPEAIHHKAHPFALGVQWHPEHLFEEQEMQKAVFLQLIQAAAKGGRRKLERNSKQHGF